MANGNSGLLSKVREDARGRWIDILSTVAGIPHESLDGRHHPCPKCGGTDRFRAFDDVAKTGGVICNQCFNEKNGDGFAAVAWSLGLPFYQSLLKVADHVHTDQSKRRREARGESGDLSSASSGSSPHPGKVVAAFDYRDEAGTLLYQSVRIEPGREGRDKDFTQRAPKRLDDAGNPKGWTYKTKGIRRVLYRLPELLAADAARPVFIVEGEKKADQLLSLGLVATCSVGGAGNWREATNHYSESLAGRPIVILPDHDEPGQKHALDVARSLASTAPAIKIIDLPGLPEKGDVVDWLDAGGTLDQLRDFVQSAPLWRAAPFKPIESEDDPHRLARICVGSFERIHQWRDEWFVRSRGDVVYKKWSKEEIRAHVNRTCKEEFDRLNINQQERAAAENDDSDEATRKVTSSLVTNVVEALKSSCVLPDHIEMGTWLGGPIPERKTWVALQNGILKIEEMLAGESDHFIPHHPDWFSSICLPYAYDPEADCLTWRAFLERNLEGDRDRINLLQEWAGYILTPSTDQQKFLILEGEGANGKSVYLAAMEATLGIDNVAHVPLEIFGQRFQLTPTINRLANIAADCGEIDHIAEGYLKSYTSGDRMTFDRKNLPAIEASPTARLMLATNNRPRFSDKSGGIWRRMLLVPFKIEIPESDRVTGMDKVDWWERTGELPGLFNWAIEGLRRLRERGRFQIPEMCREAVQEYRSESNPARTFLLEFYTFVDPSPQVDAEGQPIIQTDSFAYEIETQELYKAYRDWCDVNGYKALGERTFGKEVVRSFPKTKKRRGGLRTHRYYLYSGIARQEEIERPENEPAEAYSGKLF